MALMGRITVSISYLKTKKQTSQNRQITTELLIGWLINGLNMIGLKGFLDKLKAIKSKSWRLHAMLFWTWNFSPLHWAKFESDIG